MKRKRAQRVMKKLMVSFSDNGFDGLGMTDNISKKGMCVESDIELPTHREIILSIAVPGEIFNLKGEVVWYKVSGKTGNDGSDLMGIRLTETPPEYVNYVEYIRHNRDF